MHQAELPLTSFILVHRANEGTPKDSLGQEYPQTFSRAVNKLPLAVTIRLLALRCQGSPIDAQTRFLFLHIGMSLLQRSIDNYMTI